jgi:hypothetical protein
VPFLPAGSKSLKPQMTGRCVPRLAASWQTDVGGCGCAYSCVFDRAFFFSAFLGRRLGRLESAAVPVALFRNVPFSVRKSFGVKRRELNVVQGLHEKLIP